MTQTLESTPKLDADAVTEIASSYLSLINSPPLHLDFRTADWAAEVMLRDDLIEMAKLIGPNLFIESIFGEGVKFGIECAVTTINEPPEEALPIVRKLFENLKAGMQQEIAREREWRREYGHPPEGPYDAG
jgi:hypothetical protein